MFIETSWLSVPRQNEKPAVFTNVDYVAIITGVTMPQPKKRQVTYEDTIFVGLDVHKYSIDVALA